VSDRVERLAALLQDEGVAAMLVSDLVNVRYLTGYTGTNGLALVGPDVRTFITDFRYVEQAAAELDRSFERRTAPVELFQALDAALAPGELRLGFEEAHLSVRQHSRLRELLGARVELVGIDGAVERLRAVKDGEELARIRAASELADAAFEDVIADGLIGRRERDIALALELEMRRRGAPRPSFETIVASGPHGALPHATPRAAEIGAGELVVIDWGAELDGYCSDCTRTLVAGQPSARSDEVYRLVLDAQLAGVEAVRAGASCRAVDAAARTVIEEAGQGERFGHGLGHGVGLVVHEAPRLSLRSDEALRAGNVVTVEPGIYIPGELGVRIEDLVIVGDGGSEILSSVDKELTVVD